MSDLTGVLIAIGLLAFNAFFVGAEFALISARRSQIEPRAQAGSRVARTNATAYSRMRSSTRTAATARRAERTSAAVATGPEGAETPSAPRRSVE